MNANRLAVFLICIGLFVSGACTSGGESDSSPSQTSSGSATPAWGGEACKSKHITCRERAGLPTLMITGREHDRNEAVLIDLGGPGRSVEQTVEAVGALGILSAYDVLIIGEPWQVHRPSEKCLTKEATRVATYATLSDTFCDLAGDWAFSAANYRAAVEQTLAENETSLAAAVGVSFGAVRVAAATPRDLPLMLVTPAPPNGSAHSIMEARAAAINAAAKSACQAHTACLNRLAEIDREPTTQADYERALALIGAATNSAKFGNVAKRLGSGALDSSEIRRRAFAATYRYGEGEVLSNLLGYRAGICSVYGDSDPHAKGLAGVLNGVLRCPGGYAVADVSPVERTGCVFIARSDLVTPAALSAQWLSDGSRLKQSSRTVSRHGSLDGHAKDVLLKIPESLEAC